MTDQKLNIKLSPDASMREVMASIDKSAKQIALIVDSDDHLLGTVTDGDIRRALLSGMDMQAKASSFMNANPITGIVDESPALWQRTMQRHSLHHLPLLDATGRFRELAQISQPLEPERNNTVILMAGGLGTRLRPLTEAMPKPLLAVGDKPILQTIIENFTDQGFSKFILCINYQGEKIRQFCGDGSRWNAEIQYLEEDKPLGTAGALSLLDKAPREPFFVMNADLLTKVDYVRLLDFHQNQGHIASMCVREYRHQIPYGVVKLDKHRIVNVIEKPNYYYYVNAGIYCLSPEVLQYIPKDDYFDMTELFAKLIKLSKCVGSFPLREYWMDVGRMDDFRQADQDYFEQFG